MAWQLRHDALLLTATFAFGVLVLPFAVYLTGTYLLGTYSAGGAMGFFGDFLRALASMRWYAWSLALKAAIILVAVWLQRPRRV